MIAFPKEVKLSTYSLVLSIFTLLAYHFPFVQHAARCLEGSGANAVLLIGLALVVLLGVNFLFYYLLVYCFRLVGRILIALTLVGNSIMLYGVMVYDTLVTDQIMASIFKSSTRKCPVSSPGNPLWWRCCWAYCPPCM